jgi:NADH dehydrogenase
MNPRPTIAQPAPRAANRADPGEQRSIVIVGGGLAGAAVAKRLQKRLPEGHRLVMVSEESYTTFNPMLAEVVGASIFPEHVVAPLRQVVRQGPRVRFIMGHVSAIDLARRAITCATLNGEAILPYDAGRY